MSLSNLLDLFFAPEPHKLGGVPHSVLCACDRCQARRRAREIDPPVDSILGLLEARRATLEERRTAELFPPDPWSHSAPGEAVPR